MSNIYYIIYNPKSIINRYVLLSIINQIKKSLTTSNYKTCITYS